MKECLRCGYSEIHERRQKEREIDRYTISKNAKINNFYLKIFGKTDKKITFKLFRKLIAILILLWIFYSLFFYIDFSNKCYVTIRPAFTELSNLTIKKGIKYLKNNFPNQYNVFCQNVGTIDPNTSCGNFGGGCYSSYLTNPRMIDVSTPYGNYKAAAKVIIHETCHAVQFSKKRPFDEDECYKKDEVIPYPR